MKKILVADDNPSISRLLARILEREGYQVLIASNGVEALRKAQEEETDLLLLDVMLPGLDGFEVCHRLRAAPSTAQLPIWMFSGKAQESDREAGLEAGADEYLTKPVEPAQLLSRIERLFAQRPAARRVRGKAIAFIGSNIGSKDGVGASTVVVNIAPTIASRGHSVILVDLYPYFDAVRLLSGIQPEHTIAELFGTSAKALSRDAVEAILTTHPSGVRILWSGQALEEDSKVSIADMEALMEELCNMADYVLIDVPAYPSDVSKAILGKCDLVTLVGDSRADGKARINWAIALLSKLGIHEKRLRLVTIERNGVNLERRAPATEPVTNVALVGAIPYDAKACFEAEEKGVPIVVAAPDSAMASALKNLAEELLR